MKINIVPGHQHCKNIKTTDYRRRYIKVGQQIVLQGYVKLWSKQQILKYRLVPSLKLSSNKTSSSCGWCNSMAKECLFLSSSFAEWVSFDKIPLTEYDWAVKLSRALYHKSYDDLWSYETNYIIKQIIKIQNGWQLPEFVLEKLVLAYAS